MTTNRYAQSTTVSSEKSRAEIESTLRRYGASSFMYGTTSDRAIVAFEAHDRRIKFELPMPKAQSGDRIDSAGRRYQRTEKQCLADYDQAVRQKWRALALCIKAKLEAVEAGITTFESEFLAHIVLPGGQTVGETAVLAIAEAYSGRKMPPLLGHSK